MPPKKRGIAAVKKLAGRSRCNAHQQRPFVDDELEAAELISSEGEDKSESAKGGSAWGKDAQQERDERSVMHAALFPAKPRGPKKQSQRQPRTKPHHPNSLTSICSNDTHDSGHSDSSDKSTSTSQERNPDAVVQSIESVEPTAAVQQGPREKSARSKTARPKPQLEPIAPDDTPPPEREKNALDMSAYIQPSQHRHMRACMVCSIVRTYQQFLAQGCPNCENFMELTGNSEAIQDCTSQVFDGLMSVSNTSKSWVARYQRLEGYVPGVYAVQVEGVLPEDVVVAAENAGIHYIPRDGSVSEALPTDG